MKTLRVMTYNIQHGHVHLSAKPGDEIDLTKVGDVIRKVGADIIGLNEVRGNGGGSNKGYTAQAEFLANYLGFHCYFGRAICFGGGPYGNAILSRWPIVEAKVIRIPDPVDPKVCKGYFEPRCIVRCEVEVPFGSNLAVYSTHFGLNPEEAEHAVTTAVTVLMDEHLPHVLMGDFNLTPDSPMLAPLYRTMNATDELIPEGERMTFPSHAPECKIDYIFTSRNIKPVCAKAEQVVASDHCPVWADLEWE